MVRAVGDHIIVDGKLRGYVTRIFENGLLEVIAHNLPDGPTVFAKYDPEKDLMLSFYNKDKNNLPIDSNDVRW